MSMTFSEWREAQRKKQEPEKEKKQLTEGTVQGWAESAQRYLTDVQDYYSTWKNQDPTKEKELDDRATSLLASANNFRQQYWGNDEAVASINDVVKGLSEASDWAKQMKEFWKNDFTHKYIGKNYRELKDVLERAQSDGMPKDSEEYKWLESYAAGMRQSSDAEYELSLVNQRIEELEYYEKDTRVGYFELMGDILDGSSQRKFEHRKAVVAALEEAKDEKYFLEKELKYRYMNQNEDFGEASQYVSPINVDDIADFSIPSEIFHMSADELIQLYINEGRDNDKVKRWIDRTSIRRWTFPKWYYTLDHMRDDEAEVYNYLYKTEGKDSAYEYMEYLEYFLDQRKTQATQTYWEKKATEAPYLSDAVSILAKLVSGAGAIDIFRQNINRDITQISGGEYTPINYNTAATLPTHVTSAIRDTRAMNLANFSGTINFDEKEHPILAKLLNGKSLGDVYQFGMGAADSAVGAVTSVITGGATAPFFTVALSGAAASQGIVDAVKNGATDEQALLMGLLNGAAEYIFEKFELDSILKNADDGFSKALRKSMVSEGVGEGATNIANTLTDIFVMAEKSQWQKNINNYTNSGLNEEDAIKQAFVDKLIEIGWDTVGGSISGGFMGGTMQIVQSNIKGAQYKSEYSGYNAAYDVAFMKYLGEGKTEAAAAKLARADARAAAMALDKNNERVTRLVNEAVEADPNSTYAARQKARLDSGKPLSGNTLANLGGQIESVNADAVRLGVASKKYGNQAQAMFHTYSVGQDVEKFDKAYEYAYNAGRDGVNRDVALGSDSAAYLTDSQKQSAYEAGVAAAVSKKDIKYDVSKGEYKGKTLQTSTNKTVKVVNIDSIGKEGVKLRLEDGTTVDAKEISFGSQGEALLYSVISELDVTTAEANRLIDSYKNSGNDITAEQYAMGIEVAYRHGSKNISEVTTANNGFASILKPEQRSYAYAVGARHESAKNETAQRAISEAVAQIESKGYENESEAIKAKGRGRVLFEKGVKPGTKQERYAVALAKHLAKALGINIVFYDSSTKTGELAKSNGFYDTNTDTMYLDMQRADSDTHTIVFTMSHELVHFIKKWSPAKFKVFANFLVEQYGEHGYDIESLIFKKMEDIGSNNYDEAFEEVVADACERMLLDSHAMEKLIELRAIDGGLVDKIKAHIASILNKIRSYFNGKTTRAEAEMLQKMDDVIGKFYELFEDMATDSAKAHHTVAAEGGNISTNADIQMQRKGVTKDGRTIYKTNYPDNTPKSVKQNDIISLVQNVWCKKPIKLTIINNGKAETITAKFNPELSERSDLSKIVFGNRKGTASEKRITLNLSFDLYQIAEDSIHTFGKDESGKKNNPAHDNARRWEYFVTNLVYEENDGTQIDCYMNIDVKVTSSGEYFYSFAIEKGTAPQTLLAEVSEKNSPTVPSKIISQPKEIVKENEKNNFAGIKRQAKVDKAGDSGYNNDELYTSTDDFYRDVDWADRSLFARSLANKTSSVADGDMKLVSINGNKIYWFLADGYMHGKMVRSHSSNITREDLNAIKREIQDEIYRDSTTITLWSSAIQSRGRGNILNNGDTSRRGRTDGVDAIYGRPSGFDSRRNNVEGGGYYYTDEDVKGIVNRLKTIYGIADTQTTNHSEVVQQMRTEKSEVSNLQDISGENTVQDTDGRLSEILARENKEISKKTVQSPIKFQRKITAEPEVSNREILANALESVTQHEVEAKKLQEYKEHIELLNSEEKKLRELKAEIKELSFAVGHRDTARIKALKVEATKTENRINIHDKKLLSLEATEALKNVLEREKARVRKADKEKLKDAVAGRNDYYTRKLETMKAQYQESRAKAVEGRKTTAMRNKVLHAASELNSLLLHGNKKRHVPERMKRAVAEALDAFNLDNSNAEKRIASLEKELESATTDKEKNDIYAAIAKLQSRSDDVKAKLTELHGAYKAIAKSANPEISMGFDEAISERLDALIERIANESDGETKPVRDMTFSELEDVYTLFRAIRKRISEANKTFSANLTAGVTDTVAKVGEELDSQKRHRSKSIKPLSVAEKFSWNNEKPISAFERIRSKTLTKLYENIRHGEDVWATDMVEAKIFAREVKRKYGFKSWDMQKEFTFSSLGKEFNLTTAEIMSLYAYSKRDQAREHIRKGGIQFDENARAKVKRVLGFEVEMLSENGDFYNISDEVLYKMISKLTKEQRAFVDEMQAYLSDTMGAKGNEVSMALYDVELFKEENYFPLHSSRVYNARIKDAKNGDFKLKNSSFANETVANANSPIVLTPFMDVWAEHVHEMSMYHSFVLPLEDFYRIYNFNSGVSEETAASSVKNKIIGAHGFAASNYVEQLLRDINGDFHSDLRESPSKAMVSKFKKAAVLASLSVAIQQPSAIGRAFDMISPKYFVGRKLTVKGHEAKWEELKKYAPVAAIKEIGHSFDVNIGSSSKDFLLADERSGFGDKLKGFVTDGSYRDEVLGALPGYLDEVTWISIWEAVKREAHQNNPDIDVKSDAFLEACGKRFTDIITHTQVYDSVLSKSANMRSNSVFMSMLTSFMAEGTTAINMFERAVRGFKENPKKSVRTLASLLTSITLNALFVSLTNAMRDDDEDKNLLEKYLSSFATEMLEGVNPLTYVPITKDVWSILRGYDVERADMTLIDRATDALTTWVRLGTTDTSEMDEDKRREHEAKYIDAAWDFALELANLLGVPAKNIKRDLNGFVNLLQKENRAKFSALSVSDAIWDEVRKATPVLGWTPGKSKTDKLYRAIVTGDEAYTERILSGYKNPDSALEKALRENDERIKEAAQMAHDGNMDGAMKLLEEIKKEGNFKPGIIIDAINAERNKLEPDKETETVEKVKGLFKTADYYSEIVDGDERGIKTAYNDIIDTAIANGTDEADAVSSLESSVRKLLKKDYMEGTIETDKAVSILTSYCGNSEDDALEYVQAWDFYILHPEVDWSTSQVAKYKEFAETVGISVDVFGDFLKTTGDIKGVDKDGDGKADITVQEQIVDYIDSLDLSRKQKDALYMTKYKKTYIYSTPWH